METKFFVPLSPASIIPLGIAAVRKKFKSALMSQLRVTSVVLIV
nr:hypothetical protein [Desulfuribacillus stibiiarsenatis]